MNKVIPSKQIVLFLCCPNLGILDNWLSVIWYLKEQSKDIELFFIIPEAMYVEQIDLSNVLCQLADKVFDRVIFMSHTGVWLSVDTFFHAKTLNKLTMPEKVLVKLIRKLKRYKFTNLLGDILQRIYSRNNSTRQYLYDWSNFERRGSCLLYDIYYESASYNIEFMKQIQGIPKFSITHGMSLASIIPQRIPSILERSTKERTDVIAYLFSEKQISYYQSNFKISKPYLKVVGIPRHCPQWINLLFVNSYHGINDLGNDFIFVISRPANTVYHPPNRKRQSLQDIKQLAWNDLEKKIVVKLHPKESRDGLCEEVFGQDTYGKKWVYSNLHPFILGRQSLFAIAFASGVVVDMIALGVPTIERIDLKNIPECDNENSLRDSTGEPITHPRYLGLVLGASNYQQMKNHAMEIIHNRQEVIAKLRARYEELFPQIDKVNECIAKDILSSIKQQSFLDHVGDEKECH